jgi:hypothetical protein
MERTRRVAGRLGRAAVVLVAGFSSACLVEIDHVSDPGPAFAEARREAERYQGRRGPAHHVNVLVYDHDEGQLVRVNVPMWLARKVAHHEEGFDIDLGDEGAERAVKRHLRWEDLERAGLGVLVEVEEDGGDQVLVWLK